MAIRGAINNLTVATLKAGVESKQPALIENKTLVFRSFPVQEVYTFLNF